VQSSLDFATSKPLPHLQLARELFKLVPLPAMFLLGILFEAEKIEDISDLLTFTHYD
jgi:hypothetical protein